jgi:hypothetical protein
MDRKRLEEWLEGYGRAWQERDPDAAAALFSEAAEYYETPFEAPYRGREGVLEYWRDATGSQRDVSFSYEVLSLASNTGIAHWAAEFTRIGSGQRVRLDGVLVLVFAEDGLCCTLREWWHVSNSPQPDTRR